MLFRLPGASRAQPAAPPDPHAADVRVMERWANHLTPPPPPEVIDRVAAHVRDHPDDALATVMLAEVYRRLECGRYDPAKAKELYARVAKSELPTVRAMAGGYYVFGPDDTADPAKGFPLLQKAAEAKDPHGLLLLGEAYYFGKGVAKDEAKAKELCEKAAAAGSLHALYNLAAMEKDKKRVLEIIGSAAQAGEPAAQFQLGQAYGAGAFGEKDPGRAVEWIQKSADNGNAEAALMLSRMYEGGSYVQKDSARALELCRRAAGWGYAPAEAVLWQAYLTRKAFGVAVDAAEGRRWLFRAAEHGDANSQQWVGLLYAGGFGAARDLGKARELLARAHKSGKAPMAERVSRLLDPRNRDDPDSREALDKIRSESDAGNGDAQVMRGVLVAAGAIEPVGADAAAEGREWIEKSARAGSTMGRILSLLAAAEPAAAPILPQPSDPRCPSGSRGAAPSGRSTCPGTRSGG
jgi:TPR repeat protein